MMEPGPRMKVARVAFEKIWSALFRLSLDKHYILYGNNKMKNI